MSETEMWIEALRGAIDDASSDDIKEKHRKTIRRSLEASLLEALQNLERQETLANEGKAWKASETEMLKKFLENKQAARSYQEASEVLGTISLRLKRSRQTVARKATELELGEKVDFWLSKARYGFS
jgi:hypothetical protein